MNDLDLLVELFAKAGKPVVESKEEPTAIKYQPIVMDFNWMNDATDATKPESLKRLQTAVANVVPGSIAELNSFIQRMNQFLNEEIDVDDHVASIAKVDVLRTLHNLLSAPNQSAKGYQFEHLLAEIFGGKVIQSTATNLADVDFPGMPVSLKFIKPGSNVQGSYKNLRAHLQSDGYLTYIVGEKFPEDQKIRFYRFVINIDAYNKMESSLSRNKKNRLVKGGTFVLKPDELKDSIYEFNDVGTLDLSNAVPYTEKLFEALDTKFKSLFSTLQELVTAAERFKTDASLQGKKASKQKEKTIKKTVKTKAAAEKI